jgi:uncharacterized protein (TIGR02679 family)
MTGPIDMTEPLDVTWPHPVADAAPGAPRPMPARLRSYLSAPELHGLWSAARNRLERNGLQISGALNLDLDDAAADRLSGLLGRSLPAGPNRTVRLTELDAALRRSAAAQGLISVVESLGGRTLDDRTAARRDAQAQWAKVWQRLDTSLAEADLADPPWIPDWIAGLRRTGILTRAGTDAATTAVTHAVAALSALADSSAPQLRRPSRDGPPHRAPANWELAALATRVTGDAHGLDDSRLSCAILLRAAALALDRPPAESAADRRELWQALGVATDAVSGTVLTWSLRPPGAEPWSVMLRERADLGLITHLTMHELERAGDVAYTAAGQAVSVCENPQVLQAAAHAGATAPLVCLSGNPATVGTRLLRALLAAGNPVRYHGDFDWPGIAIAGRVIAAGATAWRMSAADYAQAVDRLDADHAVALTGRALRTPWDPALAPSMRARGLAVHEESVLGDLLADLSA